MSITAPPHPMRVRPDGARLADDDEARRANHMLRHRGLGKLAALDDHTLLRILGMLDHPELCALAVASKAARAFALNDDLWRALLLSRLPDHSRLVFDTTWRRSYARGFSRQATSLNLPPAKPAGAPTPPAALYSDALFLPWLCGTASIPQRWLSFANITRVRADALSVSEFERRFEAPGLPVIIEGLVERWPAYTHWSEASLRSSLGETKFHVGGHEMELGCFLDYAAATTDELPLYLFDKDFAAKAPRLATEYETPPYFSAERDLFADLPPGLRPANRWLIIGGTRSGATWHVDPNATSAWNACVYGSKKWILCPPRAPPPGVTASDDGTMVVCPISNYEWFRNYYSAIEERRATTTDFEGVARAGDLIYVPRGWWHATINLESTVAITHNYAPASSARHVAAFLKSPNAQELVSGVDADKRANLHEHFAKILSRYCSSEEADERPKTKSPLVRSGAGAHDCDFRFGFG